jgi:maleylpyruvate isomerase
MTQKSEHTSSASPSDLLDQPPLILRGYWRSSATWRVRIALHYKNIDFQYLPVHLVREGGEQHQPDYKRLNPLAQVPTLELPDGALLTQSLAIIDYLEHLVPTPPLYPSDPILRARALQCAEIINSNIQPLQNLSLLQRLARDYNADKVVWARREIGQGLYALENTLNAHMPSPLLTTPQFLVGDTPTVAELCLIPQLYNARRFRVDLSACPRLLAAEAACSSLAAFKLACPEAQLDAQPS